MGEVAVEDLTLAYEKRTIVRELSLSVPEGRITALVGPNGCGKSTLLRGLARLLKPKSGCVYLDGHDIARLHSKELARKLGLLPQSPSAPDGLLVEDLVSRGRYPHQSWLAQWSRDDERAVDEALQLAGAAELRGRFVDELSGGQRQRVWIAMALAQETTTLLLDEPTTFLDIAYQIEVMELLQELHERKQRTIIVVLHDLNQACRYAHHLIALKAGAIVAQGNPCEIVDEDLIRQVFDLDCRILTDPESGTPLFVSRQRSRPSAACAPTVMTS